MTWELRYRSLPVGLRTPSRSTKRRYRLIRIMRRRTLTWETACRRFLAGNRRPSRSTKRLFELDRSMRIS
jgi:hypothetical protein